MINHSKNVIPLQDNTGKIREMEGASTTFSELKAENVHVVVSTGFPVEVAEPLIDHIGWVRDGLVDSWTCSELVGASRPDPAMILESMKKYNVSDPKEVIKIDDTVKGVEEGLNANAYTIAVLTGTQNIQMLDASGPDMILRSVKEVPGHLRKKGMI